MIFKRAFSRATGSFQAPRHVAIIMDGNGRWAQARGLPRTMGHKVGAERVTEIIEAAHNLGIKYLSLYCFSTENWKRPQDEVSTLMTLLFEHLEKQRSNFVKNQLKFHAFGEIHRLPKANQDQISEMERFTANHKGLQLNFFLSYGGRREIVEAAKVFAKDVQNGKINVEDLDEEKFRSYLYTSDVPDPEVVIRTSGEFRISNFLLWQSAYSEFYILKKSWPQFHAKDLRKACEVFQGRVRRFGATTEQVMEVSL